MEPTASHPSALVRLADWSYRRRRVVVVLWILLLVGSIVASGRFGGENDFDFATPGAESQEAQQLLQAHFPARAGDEINVVFASETNVDDPTVRPKLEAIIARFAEAPHVGEVVSPFSAEGGFQIAPTFKVAFAVLRLDVTIDDYDLESAKALVALAEETRTPELDVELAGFALQGAEQAEFSSEGIGLLVAAFILLISFGSLLAMGLPILVAMFGLGIGLSLIALLANVLQVPDFAPQVASMIGIGVGIDYVLFIVTRYRTALHGGLEPRAAVITAITTSGRAVLFAGCTVIISLLGLFVMNLGFLRGLAVGAVSAVLIVMLASVTLLPALLGFAGRNIDKLRVPWVGRKETGDRRSWSYRWSRVVQRRPLPAALICLVLLLGLAAPALSMDFGFPDAGTAPQEFTTRRAYDLLSQGFGPGYNGPLIVAVPKAADADAVRTKVRDESDGVQLVSPVITSPDGEVSLLVAYPTTSPQDQATEDLVHRLRNQTLAGTGAMVTGSTAASIDATQYVVDRLGVFIGVVILLSFLLLLVVFRSLLVPLKAAIMNLLSVTAAYGVVATMVQGGWFGGLFGINDPVPVPSFIPMMMFAILFGLSMDYEVFLLSRIREEYVKSGDNASAVADGLAHTARVITAAAAIMISVFLAFVLNDEVFLKMIGIGLATAIFVDATIVRMILVPATMELLGDANWWLPSWLSKRLPEFHVEGESAEAIEAELAELVRAHGEKPRSESATDGDGDKPKRDRPLRAPGR